MRNDEVSPELKECCKAAVEAQKQAHKQERVRKNARSDSFQSLAMMAVLAIGVPLLFIFNPPLVWGYMNTVTIVIGVLAWIVLIIEFRKWLKAKQTKIAS